MLLNNYGGGSSLEKIVRRVLAIISGLAFIYLFFFCLCWHYDGFTANSNLFFGKKTLSIMNSFFSLIGLYELFISMFLSLVVVGIIEWVIGRRLTNRKVATLIDIISGIVGFLITALTI